jgi:glycine hydroxymethyltransferase
MGLILGGALPNPLDHGTDSFGGSAHKTFPGPQKGFLATRDDQVAVAWTAAAPTWISSHHLAACAGLGLASLLFVLADGPGYARATVANAQALARALAAAGLPVVGEEIGYTAGHQIWVRTLPLAIPAHQAAERLYHAGIRVNFLSDLPVGESALRLGAGEATRLGMTEADMPALAAIITAAILGTEPSQSLARRTENLRSQAGDPWEHRISPRARDLAAALAARLLPRPAPIGG